MIIQVGRPLGTGDLGPVSGNNGFLMGAADGVRSGIADSGSSGTRHSQLKRQEPLLVVKERPFSTYQMESLITPHGGRVSILQDSVAPNGEDGYCVHGLASLLSSSAIRANSIPLKTNWK
jgi:hypothetical protein